MTSKRALKSLKAQLLVVKQQSSNAVVKQRTLKAQLLVVKQYSSKAATQRTQPRLVNALSEVGQGANIGSACKHLRAHKHTAVA